MLWGKISPTYFFQTQIFSPILTTHQFIAPNVCNQLKNGRNSLSCEPPPPPHSSAGFSGAASGAAEGGREDAEGVRAGAAGHAVKENRRRQLRSCLSVYW